MLISLVIDDRWQDNSKALVVWSRLHAQSTAIVSDEERKLRLISIIHE